MAKNFGVPVGPEALWLITTFQIRRELSSEPVTKQPLVPGWKKGKRKKKEVRKMDQK